MLHTQTSSPAFEKNKNNNRHEVKSWKPSNRFLQNQKLEICMNVEEQNEHRPSHPGTQRDCGAFVYLTPLQTKPVHTSDLIKVEPQSAKWISISAQAGATGELYLQCHLGACCGLNIHSTTRAKILNSVNNNKLSSFMAHNNLSVFQEQPAIFPNLEAAFEPR